MNVFTAGGTVFWILVLLALIAIVVFFERFFELRRAQIDCQDFIKGMVNILDAGGEDEALAVCDETSAPVAAVTATAIRQRHGSAMALRDAVDSQGRAEIGRLDRRLATLAIIGQISPLIGLLGTVIGFMRAVLATEASALVSRSALLTPAMEALTSAAAGLAVATMVSVMYGALRVRLDRIVVELEAAASRMVGYLAQKEAGR